MHQHLRTYTKYVITLWLFSFASLSWASIPCVMQIYNAQQTTTQITPAPDVAKTKSPRSHCQMQSEAPINKVPQTTEKAFQTCPHCEFAAFINVSLLFASIQPDTNSLGQFEKALAGFVFFNSLDHQPPTEPPKTV